jgi:hypothetical protein
LNKAPYIAFDETNNLNLVSYFYTNPSDAHSVVWRVDKNYLADYGEYRTSNPYKDVFAIIQYE